MVLHKMGFGGGCFRGTTTVLSIWTKDQLKCVGEKAIIWRPQWGTILRGVYADARTFSFGIHRRSTIGRHLS